MNEINENNKKYGKVAVLMGGLSAEREISLKSGSAVLEALLSGGVDAHKVDVGKDIIQQLISGKYDRVFNMLHGRNGEDGVMQGALELLDLPYTGSGVLASAIGMDKLRTKEIWLANGLPTPEFVVVNADTSPDEVVNKLGLPLIVKPFKEGSSIGMSKVSQLSEMKPAMDFALQYDDDVLTEKWVEGDEYTAAIVAGESLPLIKLETSNTFYDFEAKYISDATQYHCPCGLEKETEIKLQQLAKKAFDAVGATGWGRVDLMVDASGDAFLIEVNTLPGMTDHSLVPMAAKQAGNSFKTLVLKILDTSCK
ncbi:MAG: D-alanine--D-alanine ligase [Gammaproteobacteria bacterium]|nr:D-alanine--D-alanine ligase [Gammaproteobacteria bacterium]